MCKDLGATQHLVRSAWRQPSGLLVRWEDVHRVPPDRGRALLWG